MPLTSKEKAARFRAKLKSNPDKYKDFKEKDKKRKMLKKTGMKKWQLKDLKERNRCNSVRARNRKKGIHAAVLQPEQSLSSSSQETLSEETEAEVFKTPQNFGRAKKRVEKMLPYSPRKRRKVIEHFANAYTSSKFKSNKRQYSPKLSAEINSDVKDFFEDNEISWQAPGQKDYIIIRHEGTKHRVQKRFLLMTLKEAYSVFCSRKEAGKISFSKFCQLRPPHVLLQRELPHTACVCRIHENIRFLLCSLNQSGLGIATSFRDFIAQVVCDQDSRQCMLMQCTECPGLTHLRPDEDLGEEECQWESWMTKDTVSKETKTGSVADCFQELEENLQRFLEHTYIKREQAAFFRDKIAHPEDGEIIVQLDFSENYEAKDQSEIQAAHWAHSQITVFTAVAWYRDEDRVQSQSYAFVSDYLSHDKYAVHVFLMKIIDDMRYRVPNDNMSLHVFSDGAASQFKQKYTLCNLTFIEGMSVSWHFFATSHGKGAVDGIGGQVKRDARLAALAGAKIHCASDFCSVIGEKERKIKIVCVKDTEIQQMTNTLDQKWANIESIPCTQKLHSIRVVAPYKIECATHSTSANFQGHSFLKEVVNDTAATIALEQEKYYAIYYDSEFYNGRILSIDDFVSMKFLEEKLNNYAWPKRDDIAEVEVKFIFYGPLT